MEIETKLGLQKPDFFGKSTKAKIEDVKEDTFNDKKVEVHTDIGVLRCFPHELKEVVREHGKESNAWKGKEILVSVEQYTHEKYGKQFRWVLLPAIEIIR